MSFETLNVLIVDDNQHMRVLLTEILRAAGIRRIVQAADGMEAMALMRRQTIDVILTDLSMVPMDGVEFVRLLRTDPDSPAPYCPVIMISGHTTLGRISDARDAGVNEFLSKPVTVRGVLGRLTRIIEHPRPYIRSKDYFGPDRRRHDNPSYTGPRRRAIEGPIATVLD